MRVLIPIVTALVTLTPEIAHSAERRIPLLVDTDFGTYLDDAFALALAAASPDVELRGVSTSGGDAENRAWMVCRFLDAAGRRDVPVAWCRPPQAEGKVGALYQYRYHPALLFGRMGKPSGDDACELMYRELKARPGEITLLVLGPQTNVARLLAKHPEAGPWIKRLVVMGGALEVGQNGRPPVEPEWNIKSDVAAAQAVLASGVRVTYVPLDLTHPHVLPAAQRERLFAAQTLLTQQLQLLDQLADETRPQLHDAVAMAVAVDPKSAVVEPACLEIDLQGVMRTRDGKPNAQVARRLTIAPFADWLVERLVAFGKRTEPRDPRNVVEPVERGGLPRRVHVFEDYETDIERRWWLAGRVAGPDGRAGPGEPDRLPAGPAGRVCRSVLTQDFDDQQGEHQTLYSAVIFNPVPGPPMGEATRLAFRYKLSGTDTLRVQMYSLTNGYHRQLTLRGLAQGEWREAAVDMTQLRRPDGSGGALAKDERIDDIQFYAAPTATVWIDDVVLYDAASTEEKRPFPRRLVFTGWFDTGKQEQEWPGDFEIVPHAPPRTWKAARSVENRATGRPWIRVSLRGERPVGKTTSLRFAYYLTGARSMEIVLANSRTQQRVARELDGLTAGAWSEHHVELDTSQLQSADELHFLLPAGATLFVDDVLLYEP
jgi:inosine-uridine nucleoside N-ribohydrolase